MPLPQIAKKATVPEPLIEGGSSSRTEHPSA